MMISEEFDDISCENEIEDDDCKPSDDDVELDEFFPLSSYL